MKKNLLLAAAMLLSAGAFAQEVSITMAEEKPFEFSADESYVTIFLGEETRATNMAEDSYIYFGPDGDNGRNLWVWSDTFDFPTPSDLNSFAIPGEYMSVRVLSVGWSGLGYNIAKANPVNLSFIDGEWAFHMAVRTQYTGPIMFSLTDHQGEKGVEANLVFGPEGSSYDGHEAIANFERDGEWYNIDIPMSYLEDQFEFTFDGATNYCDRNYFVVCCGGVEGTVVDYDAVFFHGPKVDPTLINDLSAINDVQRMVAGGQHTYNLNGQRVQSAQRGLHIVKTEAGARKVLF